MSTKSISAPQYKAQLELATKEIGDVQTSFPGPTPKTRHAKCNELVALFVATAYLEPTFLEKVCSNKGTIGP